ncbi:hypothetical protein [Streptomyces cyaneofuscatus]|uniref:hypothetical protein n=1 Tax=Streptomyces cyaneofuscatus TaxID=66883 RepID=UPI00380BC991
MSEAEELGRALATGRPAVQTVSAQVIDVTQNGVNIMCQGTLFLDVACPDSYRARAAGDWVAVRPGAVPVVLWRLGPDPGMTTKEDIREIATEVANDIQVVRAVTWGEVSPPGAGWQAGTTVHARKNAAGQVELYVQLGVPYTDPPPPPKPPRPPSPLTIQPTAADSWRGGRRDDYASVPIQGDWTGGGNRRGGWFYGSGIADACAGKTVTRMAVSFTRRTGAGANAKRPLHLYLHDYPSPPSGQLSLGAGPEELLSLSVGAKGSAALPASWRAALASGAARGLAIYASGRTDYMAVTGGALTITFSA